LLPLPKPLENVLNLPWYAVHTGSRHEVIVATGLARKGFEVFLPRITARSRRQDRVRMLEVPLFPGYLFVQTDLIDLNYSRILRQNGVVRILGTREGYTPVPEETVIDIRTLVTSGQPIFPWAGLVSGKRVRVVDGPLAGAQGVILRSKKGKNRLVVGVELLGRSVCAELAEESVEIDG
jgi:transcriptional antiterminator NusG